MEKRSNVESLVDLLVLNPAFLIKASATGNNIAATVCSQMKEDKKAEMVTNPNTILHVLLPVTFMTKSASLLSNP